VRNLVADRRACRPTKAFARSIALGVQSGATTKHTSGTSSNASMITLNSSTTRTVSAVE